MTLRIWLVLTLLVVAQCFEQCADGQLCPDGNTCCAGGCIARDLGRYNGTCCNDDGGVTGCGVGYVCGSSADGDDSCIATAEIEDPLVQILPRYRLCHPEQVTLETIHGFPVDDSVNKLAYYSSHGNIVTADVSDVDFIWIVIHGADRNADDYFCAASAAVELQTTYHNVLVVAPRFPTIDDGPLALREGGTALRWTNKDENGPWRYGAKSVHPIRVSSFAILDRLVQTILSRTSAARAARVVLFGHSSGGQFVQRWSLLTSVWTHRLRAVVANPSSYAYLNALRKVQGQWQIPPERQKCPHYNEYEWGLDDSSGAVGSAAIDDDYKRRALQNTTNVIGRFRFRDVTYTIGSLDRCNVTIGWCDSHRLETSCMDELQGSTRMERHFHYFESLGLVGINTHRRVTVKGVGHDHSLMMQRPEALAAVFGDDWSLAKDSYR